MNLVELHQCAERIRGLRRRDLMSGHRLVSIELPGGVHAEVEGQERPTRYTVCTFRLQSEGGSAVNVFRTLPAVKRFLVMHVQKAWNESYGNL
jgi:hypothetical protein